MHIYYKEMSIVTLKKKTAANYKNMSTNSKHGFSIVGGYRNQGYVGQSVISRSLPKTLIKGTGGCCGSYNKANVVLSAVTSTEDHNVMKSSVLGTDGMIATKYRWRTRPQPFSVVKPDTNNNLNNSGSHIEQVKKQALKTFASCPKETPINNSSSCNSDYSYNSHLAVLTSKCNYTKPQSNFVAMSQSEYIAALDKSCTDNNIFFVANSLNNTPLPQ